VISELSITELWIGYVRAAVAVFRRDLAIFLSYRTRPIGLIVSSLAMIVMFRFTSRLVHVGMFPTADSYFNFAVVGVVTLQVLTSTLSTPPMALRQELVQGTFERLVLSPFGPVMSTVSMMLFPLVQAIAFGTLTMLIAILGFGMHLHWSTVPLAIPAALLGALSFMPFGIMMAAAALAFKRSSSATTYVLAGIGLVAGFYFPVELLPSWIRWTSNVQPFTPGVDLMRYLLVGSHSAISPGLALEKLVGFTIVLLPISVMMLSAAIRFGKRRGTITEY
jgi:ABC-2 type transport system permease protein